MTERDIQGLFLVLRDKLPSTLSEGTTADDRALANLWIDTGLRLFESFFVDVNRIANATEVLAEDWRR